MKNVRYGKNLVVALLGFAASEAAFAQAPITTQAEKQAQKQPLPSPYFVVGFRCEGLNIEFTDLFSIFKEEERQRIANSSELDLCEKTFSFFGVEKYNWISPDDLESLELRLARFDAYAKPQLEVVAAEAPGQIYLLLKLGKRTPIHITSTLETTFYGDKNQKGMGGMDINGSLAFSKMNMGPTSKLSYGTDFSLRNSTNILPIESSPGDTVKKHSMVLGSLWIDGESAVSSRWCQRSSISA